MLQVEANGCKQQRKGNRKGNDDCAAHIAQKEKEDDHDQDHAFGQIVQYSVRGEVQQVAAVNKGNNFHSLGRIRSFSSLTF